jgi:hypothetical protein
MHREGERLSLLGLSVQLDFKGADKLPLHRANDATLAETNARSFIVRCPPEPRKNEEVRAIRTDGDDSPRNECEGEGYLNV